MRMFHITFRNNGEQTERTKTYRGLDIGNALAKWAREHPDAVLIGEYAEARIAGRHLGYVNYPPVSTAKVEPLPAVKKTEETTFPFFDECFGRRPRN
jgi:hypothetical protein